MYAAVTQHAYSDAGFSVEPAAFRRKPSRTFSIAALSPRSVRAMESERMSGTGVSVARLNWVSVVNVFSGGMTPSTVRQVPAASCTSGTLYTSSTAFVQPTASKTLARGVIASVAVSPMVCCRTRVYAPGSSRRASAAAQETPTGACTSESWKEKSLR